MKRTTINPADLLALHKAQFGDARMELEQAEGQPAPQQDAQKPAPPSEKGYPADTPVSEMTPEQRAAYDADKRAANKAARERWQQATRGMSADEVEAALSELDKVKRENENAIEKAVREAREQGANEARRESFEATAAAVLRIGLRASDVADDDLDEIVEQANLAAFEDGDGLVDDEKVARFVERNAGMAKLQQWPDMGQDHRRGGVMRESGEDLYARLHGKKK